MTEGKIIAVHISKTKEIHPEIDQNGVKWTLFIPLTYQKKSIGVLTLNKKTDQKYELNQIKILKLYGSLASLAIRNMQLYEETKKALETRDLFISLASHELRTPLTAVNGYIQLLNRNTQGFSQKQIIWVENLKTESERLTSLVKELLEINQIKSGQFQFTLEEHDFNKLITTSVELMTVTHPNRKITLENTLKDTVRICADGDKIIQLITNLVRNAIKFSPNDTPIDIRALESKSYAEIEIKDQGIGIEKKDMAKIFEGYYRGANTNKEGMGLGLYLAQHIIKGHKGSITVDSTVGEGTTFRIRLPKI